MIGIEIKADYYCMDVKRYIVFAPVSLLEIFLQQAQLKPGKKLKKLRIPMGCRVYSHLNGMPVLMRLGTVGCRMLALFFLSECVTIQ